MVDNNGAACVGTEQGFSPHWGVGGLSKSLRYDVPHSSQCVGRTGSGREVVAKEKAHSHFWMEILK